MVVKQNLHAENPACSSSSFQDLLLEISRLGLADLRILNQRESTWAELVWC